MFFRRNSLVGEILAAILALEKNARGLFAKACGKLATGLHHSVNTTTIVKDLTFL
jgi:hypothetical protein